MKKIIFMTSLLLSVNSFAGPLADMAKTNFESEMLEAIEATNANQKKINDAMSQMPEMEKQMRSFVRQGLKEKKSCLKIKRDFIKEQKELIASENHPSKELVESFLSAGGDYVATVCLDMK